MILYREIADFLALQALFLVAGICLPAVLRRWLGGTVPGLVIAHGLTAMALIGAGLAMIALTGDTYAPLRPPQWPLSVHPETLGIEFWGLGLAAAAYGLVFGMARAGLRRMGLRWLTRISVVKLCFCVFGAAGLMHGFATLTAGPDLAFLSDQTLGYDGLGRLTVDAEGPAEGYWATMPSTLVLLGLIMPLMAVIGLHRDEDAAHFFFGRA